MVKVYPFIGGVGCYAVIIELIPQFGLVCDGNSAYGVNTRSFGNIACAALANSNRPITRHGNGIFLALQRDYY